MTSSKYVPAGYDPYAVSGRFGISRPRAFVLWATAEMNANEGARARASYVQYCVAAAVRSVLRERERTQQDLADELGWNHGRLSRLLSGRQVLSLEDAMLLMDACNLEWATVIAGSGDEVNLQRVERQIVRNYLWKWHNELEEETPRTGQERAWR